MNFDRPLVLFALAFKDKAGTVSLPRSITSFGVARRGGRDNAGTRTGGRSGDWGGGTGGGVGGVDGKLGGSAGGSGGAGGGGGAFIVMQRSGLTREVPHGHSTTANMPHKYSPPSGFFPPKLRNGFRSFT